MANYYSRIGHGFNGCNRFIRILSVLIHSICCICVLLIDWQEEIEAIEGRLRYLNNQTDLSTVNIDMYQKINYNPVAYEKSFFTKVIDGFISGWKLIQVTIIGLVTIWPILLLAVAVFLARKRIRKVIAGNRKD